MVTQDLPCGQPIDIFAQYAQKLHRGHASAFDSDLCVTYFLEVLELDFDLFRQFNAPMEASHFYLMLI